MKGRPILGVISGFRVGEVSGTAVPAPGTFVLLGLAFIFLDGTNALSSVYTDLGFTELSFQADESIKDLTSWIPDGVFIGGVLLALAGSAWYILRFFGRDQTGPPEDSHPDAASHTPQP